MNLISVENCQIVTIGEPPKGGLRDRERGPLGSSDSFMVCISSIFSLGIKVYANYKKLTMTGGLTLQALKDIKDSIEIPASCSKTEKELEFNFKMCLKEGLEMIHQIPEGIFSSNLSKEERSAAASSVLKMNNGNCLPQKLKDTKADCYDLLKDMIEFSASSLEESLSQEAFAATLRKKFPISSMEKLKDACD